MNDIFLSFPFDGSFDDVFELIRDLAAGRSLNAIRIDQSSLLARPVSAAIQRRIREARLVIADITGNNPNVLNEIGLAQAFGKPLVLITRGAPTEAPFNIRNLQILRYDPGNLPRLSNALERAFV